jgi:hypothetical protein
MLTGLKGYLVKFLSHVRCAVGVAGENKIINEIMSNRNKKKIKLLTNSVQ